MPRRREDVPLRGKKSGSGEGGVPAIRSRGRAATTSVAATLAQASPSTLRKAERSSSMSKVKMTGTSTGPISGFICPACPNLINFESETLLLRHWEACHEQEVSSISVQDNTDTAWREHLFTDTCRAGKTCRFCGHRIWRDGLQCKTCRYACHIKCVTKAKPVSNCPGFYQSTNPIVKGIRKVVTGNKVRYVTEYVDLDLTYITPRIIAMSFPASGLEAAYRNNLKDVAAMLRARHGDHYLVFNVSEKEYDISKLNHQVLDFGWPDHMAPPLERLCSVITSMGSWLDSDPSNVVVVHCKGGKGRTGVVVAAYFSYMRLFPKADDAMLHFALKRFNNAEEVGDVGVTNPSQRRYVNYFQHIVTGALQVWPRPLRLLHVIMQTVPHFDKNKGCRPVLAIYEDVSREVYRTQEPLQYFAKSDRFMSLHINADVGIILRGDITIKLWHRSRHGNDHLVLRCQIHTCAVDGDVLTLEKPQLDEAYRDKRVEDTANLTLVFQPISATPSKEALNNSASAALFKRVQEMFPPTHSDSATNGGDTGSVASAAVGRIPLVSDHVHVVDDDSGGDDVERTVTDDDDDDDEEEEEEEEGEEEEEEEEDGHSSDEEDDDASGRGRGDNDGDDQGCNAQAHGVAASSSPLPVRTPPRTPTQQKQKQKEEEEEEFGALLNKGRVPSSPFDNGGGELVSYSLPSTPFRTSHHSSPSSSSKPQPTAVAIATATAATTQCVNKDASSCSSSDMSMNATAAGSDSSKTKTKSKISTTNTTSRVGLTSLGRDASFRRSALRRRPQHAHTHTHTRTHTRGHRRSLSFDPSNPFSASFDEQQQQERRKGEEEKKTNLKKKEKEKEVGEDVGSGGGAKQRVGGDRCEEREEGSQAVSSGREGRSATSDKQQQHGSQAHSIISSEASGDAAGDAWSVRQSSVFTSSSLDSSAADDFITMAERDQRAHGDDAGDGDGDGDGDRDGGGDGGVVAVEGKGGRQRRVARNPFARDSHLPLQRQSRVAEPKRGSEDDGGDSSTNNNSTSNTNNSNSNSRSSSSDDDGDKGPGCESGQATARGDGREVAPPVSPTPLSPSQPTTTTTTTTMTQPPPPHVSALPRMATAAAAMPREHEQAAWFFGRMSTQAAERLLLEKAEPSTFVVRQSARTGGRSREDGCGGGVGCGGVGNGGGKSRGSKRAGQSAGDGGDDRHVSTTDGLANHDNRTNGNNSSSHRSSATATSSSHQGGGGGGGGNHDDGAVFQLSVRTPTRVVHYDVVWQAGLGRFALQGKGSFPSLSDLVRHFQKHALAYSSGCPVLLGEGYGVRGLLPSSSSTVTTPTRRTLISLKRTT